MQTSNVDVAFGSHEVRLSGRQWAAALVLLAAVFAVVPWAWQHIERFEPDADYRIPYALSSDYWLFERYSKWAAGQAKTLVIGDSVIWGEYVTNRHTLTHYLNDLAGAGHFANMGVDGTHPAALAGLVQYYGRAVRGRHVVVHCNLLWTSSKKHDLQITKEFRFNHPRLVPQFVPSIPCYTDPFSQRLGIVVERHVPFLSWASHLRQAYFDQLSLPAWTMEHPYDSPLGAVTLRLPAPGGAPRYEPIPWDQRGLRKQNFPWLPIDTSFQWSSFQRLVAILQARRNRIFVLVGPFNEHMLTPPSLEAYTSTRRQAAAWLQQEAIPHYVAPALPSRYCADASHPLSEGHALLAEQLLADEAFVRFLAGRGDVR